MLQNSFQNGSCWRYPECMSRNFHRVLFCTMQFLLTKLQAYVVFDFIIFWHWFKCAEIIAKSSIFITRRFSLIQLKSGKHFWIWYHGWSIERNCWPRHNDRIMWITSSQFEYIQLYGYLLHLLHFSFKCYCVWYLGWCRVRNCWTPPTIGPGMRIGPWG